MTTNPPNELLTDQQLDDIQARSNAATPGPWGVYESGSMIDVAADLQETGHGYRARREIARLEDEPLDNDPAHREWTAEEDWAQVQADAVFVAHAREDVDVLLAEAHRLRTETAELRAENAKLIRWHGEDETALAQMRATIEYRREEQRALGELAARRESELINYRGQSPASGPGRVADETQQPCVHVDWDEHRFRLTDGTLVASRRCVACDESLPTIPVVEAQQPETQAEAWMGATELAADREILARAAIGLVGYRQNSGRLLHCLAHKPAPASRYTDFHEVRADDLDDGGICVHPDCGRDLLAAWPAAVSQPGKGG